MSETLTPSSAEDPEVEQGAMLPSVGAQLLVARKARLLEVMDVAQALKLGVRQVEALESGDWDVLPGQTFIRGFVRNYARLVQIDSAPLMVQLDQILKKPDDMLKLPETKGSSMPQGGSFSTPRRDRLVVIFGLLLVVAAALAYFLLAQNLSSLRETAQATIDSLAQKNTPEAAPDPATEPKQPVEPIFPPGETAQQVMNPQAIASSEPALPEAASPAVIEPKESEPVAAGGAQLRFVVDKESWVEVRNREGQIVFSERLTPGAERQLSAEGPLSLVIGYAPGVKLFLRGVPVELAPHTRGDVARLVLE